MNQPDAYDDIMLSPSEWKRAQILIVESDPQDRDALRQFAQMLGVGALQVCQSHHEALALFMERNFSHILFQAAATNIPAKAFLEKIFEVCPEAVAIPTSSQPTVDDIFSLLQIGARGFLVKPCTLDTLEASICHATKGEPFSEAILQARNRNQAFAAVLGASIDRYATLVRLSRRLVSARRDLPIVQTNTHRLARLARTFALGGEDELALAYMEFFRNLADGPAGRLGRLRDRLREERKKKKIGKAV